MATKTKRYRIDFYQLNIHPTDTVRDPWEGLEAIQAGLLPDQATHNGLTRELWQLDDSKPGTRHFFGQFRKFRTEDLPEVGAAGANARSLELAENEGVIEKNFFIFYKQHNILAWHLNGHGSSPKQFAQVLQESWGTRVTADPIIASDALERLMNNGTILKSVSLSVARPTNPEVYVRTDFARDTMGLLNGSGGDSMRISLSVDGRRGDSQGGLVEGWKSTLRDFMRIGVRTAKAKIEEGGFEEHIDLIADRVQSYQEVETDAKYPSRNAMHGLIVAARQECDGPIQQYFGDAPVDRV
ncbi:DUF6731 family protein [Alloalcanivorax sp. C16-1]|uniref:DUF6731 family protein n=1 Tax=Alloalcanivorax sp. C16-1 TaxID=3390051 RepID=UPI0039710371